MIITLIGYRGSGKSSVAPALAQRLGWQWVDADPVIEQRAGKSIREIFEQSGELEFRRLERETIADLLQGTNLVLAAGGGAILSAETRRDMRQAGPVVWLQADVATLTARIAADATTALRRPALTAVGGPTEIATLLEKREPFYRATATVILETTGRTVEQIVDDLMRELNLESSKL